ncbi:hypothetical protein FIBSPDRAFT_953685 [Athelia psychrophila]|uniref:Uncharacterized protein n=1 Tax=Athelia psychrophila TaxID=1759441 RepID=A0A166K1K1_9AGAM|nr:hypothetical protein FIBSPDRAFT_953685 [Fibularhizoctonia sp. CBS 109695]
MSNLWNVKIRFRVRVLLRQNEHLTSPAVARAELLKGHKWLDTFHKARRGDTNLQRVLARYERVLHAKRDVKTASANSLNGNQSRPQPIHISGMIHRRRRARGRQMEHSRESQDCQRDLKREAEFETALSVKAREMGRPWGVYRHHFITNKVVEPLKARYETIHQTYRLDEARLHSPYPPELLTRIKQARRER